MATAEELADQAAKEMKERNIGVPRAVAIVCRGKDEATFRDVCSVLGRRGSAHRLAIRHCQPTPARMWWLTGSMA